MTRKGKIGGIGLLIALGMIYIPLPIGIPNWIPAGIILLIALMELIKG